jgi:putative oxidoreductase
MSTIPQRNLLNDPVAQVRVICGLAYVPHILFKLNDLSGAAAFFGKVGLQPAMPFVILALVAESICAAGLTFGILTKWAGLLSAAVLAMAINAVFTLKGAVWLWNLGGVEYNVVWAVLSVIVAVQAWRDERISYGRNFFLVPSAARA